MKKKKAYMAALAAIMAVSSCSFPGAAPSETVAETAAATTTTAASEVTTTAAETTAEVTTAADTTTSKATTTTTAETTTAEETTAAEKTTVTASEETTTEAVSEEAQTSVTTKKPGLFDDIGVTTTLAQNEGIDSRGNKYVDVVFDELPTTYEEFIALPQASLSTVYDTAAMTVLALCFYSRLTQWRREH